MAESEAQVEQVLVSEARRKSISLPILLNIPYVNYLALLWVLLGGIFTVYNYIVFNRKKPGFFETVKIVFKYSFYKWISCSILSLFLLVLGFNPFLKAMYDLVWYFYEGIYVYLFGYSGFLTSLVHILGTSIQPSWSAAGVLVAVIYVVLVVFSLIGAFLGLIFLHNKPREEELIEEEFFPEEEGIIKLKKPLRRKEV